jgi:hypothetical protein
MKSSITAQAIVRSATAFLFVVVLMCSHLIAQTPAAAKKSSSVPEPIERMSKMMGKWKGNVHSETGPIVTSKELNATMEFSKSFKNLVIKFSNRFESTGTQNVLEGSGMIAYDTSDHKLHFFIAYDSGEVYDLQGSWVNNYNLNFSTSGTRNGKSLGITLWFGLKIPNQLEYKLYTTIGDDLLISDTGKLQKVSETKEPVNKK